jgi:hypothetical protein
MHISRVKTLLFVRGYRKSEGALDIGLTVGLSLRLKTTI